MKLSVATLVLLAGSAAAGPVTFTLCQTACNAGWVTCCSLAGGVAGTFTLGVGTPPALIACCAAQGACMASCAALLVAAPV